MIDGEIKNLGAYTHYSPDKWKLHEVIPYLLKYVFKEKPTSNKDLREAFWKLMGRNLRSKGVRRWSTGQSGVPHQIHLLLQGGRRRPERLHILSVYIDTGEKGEYEEDRYSYVLGKDANKVIDGFVSKWSKKCIDAEVAKFICPDQDLI